MAILVTGGTGVVGRQVVTELLGRSAEVRVLSRKTSPAVPEGVTAVRGDLVTAVGLAEATAGVDTVVHCATNAGLRDTWADVAATRRLTEAAAVGGSRPHIVYVSIVGVDRIPYGYYRAKLAAEGVIAASGLPWTTLRATQFHELAHMIVATMAKAPVLPVPRGVRSDLVDSGAVAARLAEAALAEPAGRLPDVGGPETVALEDAVHAYLRAAGLSRRVLSVPLAGRTMTAFRAGGNLLREGERTGGTFAEYLAANVRPGEPARLPYKLRGR